jgi:outer membrane autotransporter protein
VISGGRAWFDTTRPVAFTGFSGTASSNSNIDILNGGVRAAYVFGSPQLYFKPMVDAAATRLDLGGFSESGGGAANLTVASSKQTVYTIAPSLEIGTEWWMPNGTLVRPFLRGGATWYENGNLALSASFLGAPAGLTPFTIATKMDGVMGTVGAGLDVITGTDTVLHLTYDGQIGSDTQIHAIGLKGSARF